MEGPVVLVSSLHAGSAVPQQETVAALEQAGLRVIEILDVAALPEEPLGPQWHARGVVAAVAAGGDGTVGTVATHVDDAPVALGILPLGTANDTARSLGIPLGLAGAEVVARGQAMEIDVGEVLDATGRRARFLHAATLGLTAEFARLATDVEHRERFGALNYPIAAVEALAGARAQTFVIRFDDGRVVETPALQVTALNLPHLLGAVVGVDVPGVGPRDGQLTFLVVRSALAIDRHVAHGARIEAPGDEPSQVTLDGEVGGPAPVEVRILPRRLRVLVP